MFSSLTGSRSASFNELFVLFPPRRRPVPPCPAWCWCSAGVVDLEGRLLAKRDISDSLSADELTVLLAAKGSQLELETKVDQSATQVALSFKSDKSNHYTSAQTHQIFQTTEASTAALLTKRDLSDSFSADEVTTLLATKGASLSWTLSETRRIV